LVNAFTLPAGHRFEAQEGESRKFGDLTRFCADMCGYVPICAGRVPVLTTNERCLLDVS
jgi:hypothetical protein